MTENSEIRRALFVVSRVLFGGIMGFMGLDAFRSLDDQIEAAESKDVPNADLLVQVSHGMLMVGGWEIVLWRRPVIGAGSVATFFAGVTPQMHDFWNHDGEERQQQMVKFLKNTALLGAAIAFLIWGSED
jgi:putative oxidoreductase